MKIRVMNASTAYWALSTATINMEYVSTTTSISALW